MLAVLASEPPADAETGWLFELKYDGFRALYARSGESSSLRSRNDLDLGERFPAVLKMLARLRGDDFVLDGEIVALDESDVPRFQLLQRGAGGRIAYVAFDLLRLDGKDITGLPVEERREHLARFLQKPPAGVVRSDAIDAPVKDALEAVSKAGYEGLVGKRLGSTWTARRSKDWIKLKAQGRQEFTIVGFTPSTRSNSEIGALLLAVAEDDGFRFAGKVGTGYTNRMRNELMRDLKKLEIDGPPCKGAPRMKDARWVRPEQVAEVTFTEFTSDGKLRHPSFMGLRMDKRPEETRRERATPVKSQSKSGTRSAATESAAAKSGAKKGAKKSAAGKTETKHGKRKSDAAKGPEVIITSPGRVLFPRDGYTKADLVEYYERVSEPMLHALENRPLAMEHWNQGIDRGSWFHQNVEEDAEPWMTTAETPTRTSKRTITHLIADRPETLRWLAQRSVLTIHMWSSRADDLEKPDWVIFDLDPAKGKGIEQAVDTALVLRRIFDDLEIPSVPKTSGKRGIHILVPLRRGPSHEQAVEFARKFSDAVASKIPFATTERTISKRRGRLYFDALQNGYGKTVVAPYSVRAIDGAPVSAPLKWSEINKKLDPLRYTIKTMPKRLDKVGDLFAPALGDGIRLDNWSFE